MNNIVTYNNDKYELISDIYFANVKGTYVRMEDPPSDRSYIIQPIKTIQNISR